MNESGEQSEDIAFYKDYFMMLDEKPADVYGKKSLIERIFRKIQNISGHLK